MRYRSNLQGPYIRKDFILSGRSLVIMGHEIPSDPDFEPNCGYWSDDEAAILHHIAKSRPGRWLDIGARFGWTAAHLIAAGARVTLIDPALKYQAQSERMERNLRNYWDGLVMISAKAADEFFDCHGTDFAWDGFVIDGNHDSPFPLNDAKNCHAHANEASVIVFHDTWGRPIREGIEWLIDSGWSTRFYDTPNGVAVCWRDDWTPPHHIPDPSIDWAQVRLHRAPEFDFSRTV